MLRRGTNKRGVANRGATLIEVALTLGLFLGFLGAIITMAFAVFRYVMLVDTTTTMTRRIAVNPYLAGASCIEINGGLPTTYRDYLQSTFNPSGVGAATFVGGVSQDGAGGCDVSMTATWEVPCFFCNLFKIPNSITTVASAKVDSPDFLSCGGGCSTCP